MHACVVCVCALIFSFRALFLIIYSRKHIVKPPTPDICRCVQTAIQICCGLGLSDLHIYWPLSEALFRLRAPPSGPLCEWLWIGEKSPLHAVLDKHVGPDGTAENVPNDALSERDCRVSREEGVSNAVRVHGLPPALNLPDQEPPWQPSPDAEEHLADAAPLTVASSTGSSTLSDMTSSLPRRGSAVSHCRHAVSPAVSDPSKASLRLRSPLLGQRPEGHLCPSSPETAAVAHQRYSNAIHDLAGMFPGEDILLVTHGVMLFRD